jgi:hypothetical protein
MPMERWLAPFALVLIAACSGSSAPVPAQDGGSAIDGGAATDGGSAVDGGSDIDGGGGDGGTCSDYRALKNAYFGDLHAHTSYSLDAYSLSTRNTPLDAYAFARGRALQIAAASPDGGGPTTTIERPLDFLALTDHSEFLVATYGCGTDLSGTPYDPASPFFDGGICETIRSTEPATQTMVFDTMGQLTLGLCDGGQCGPVYFSAWQSVQGAAAAANVPCQFTSFVGFEWSHVDSSNGATLHKNVIFRTDQVPVAPLNAYNYASQEALWSGLDAQCVQSSGCEAITIPHNSNLSQGEAFNLPMGREAQSAKYQKLVEIFQHKGNSECFYDSSADAGPQDPECHFEYVGGVTEPNLRQSYVRYGLYEGLARADGGVNPYMMGFIGSTDDHNGTPGNTREDTWPGHAGRGDDTPAKRIAPPPDGGLGLRVSRNPGGLAVAWAEQNTRDAIFAAFRRRETYATSGTRPLVRFYQTWSSADPCADPNFPAQVVAAGGVPMGGTFGTAPAGATGGPRFVVYAWKDKTDLARIDIVKMWFDASGAAHESIAQDVIPAGSGSARCFAWQDTSFTPGPTLYYARVLELPTPRWSVGDCAAAPGVAPFACADGGALNVLIQERAWTSPIWFAP